MKWCHNSIVGCTDTNTVLLDFDNEDFKTVLHWASRTIKRFKLGGFLILKSSERNYHVVFNREVDWGENMRVVAWVALLSHNKGLERWHRMQCIKMGSTLRISPKEGKPSPRIVYREGREDDRIADFLRFRRIIKA